MTPGCLVTKLLLKDKASKGYAKECVANWINGQCCQNSKLHFQWGLLRNIHVTQRVQAKRNCRVRPIRRECHYGVCTKYLSDLLSQG